MSDARRKPIPINHIKRLCEDNNLHGVVSLGFDFSDPERPRVMMTSYGETKAICKALGSVGEQVVYQIEKGLITPEGASHVA